jgi:hypothetical protein
VDAKLVGFDRFLSVAGSEFAKTRMLVTAQRERSTRTTRAVSLPFTEVLRARAHEPVRAARDRSISSGNLTKKF